MLRGRRVLLIRWATLVVVVALVATTATALYRLRGEVHDTKDELADTKRDLGSLGRANATTAAALDASRIEAAARTAERDQLSAGLDDTRQQLDATGAAVVQAEGQINEQGTFIDLLNTCLDGVNRALNATAVDDARAATAALSAVAGACRAVEDARGGANGSPFLFDFADPFVLEAGGRYYGYSTNGGGGNVQLITADTLGDWQWGGNALPQLPPWATANRTWAPSVLARPGGYVLYYTASDAASGRQCISRAVAAAPDGPFVDDSVAPLVCQLDRNGSIDPSPFVDSDGTAYLVWKSEGLTSGAEPARLWAQALAPDGLTMVGDAAELLAADRAWERGVVEGPAMVRGGDGLWLFYSAASWNSSRYGVGYARCDGPLGPCTKATVDAPVLGSGDGLVGPGGQEFFVGVDGVQYMAFHAWEDGKVGYPNHRRLHLRAVTFAGGAPLLTPV